MTVATGEISDAEADRAGLVPTHAYAMLDIREVKVRITLSFFMLCLYCLRIGSFDLNFVRTINV